MRAVAVLVFLAACSVGEYGEMGSTTGVDAATSTAGEASFNSTIKPLVMTACVSCHGGGTPPNLSSFATLTDRYKMKPGSGNILVTKGPHQGIQYFTPTDKTTVQNWIDSL
jgi:hypothetical protein